MKLRPYQQAAKDAIYNSWAAGNRNVCAVLPTGAGKTVLFSNVASECDGGTMAVAHRQELVSQISLALARYKVRHKIISPASTVKLIVQRHFQELGTSFYDPNARHGVAGVDTLIRAKHNFPDVKLWIQDECHHMLRDNKWGRACDLFPNARGLGVTATPERADGKGIGRVAQGLFDDMVVGPNMRDLINANFLTDYRIFSPPNDIDLKGVTITASGDYSREKLKSAVRKSKVVGDVVEHYLKIARGKLGVTFATDVETATDITTQFNNAGVPAEVVSAKTKEKDRAAILEKFKNRQLLQLVNVDLFGEGFDLPAIEVVSMARPTQSYGLYVQQFGRALRIMKGKTEALIIDHVGNVIRHGLPDAGRQWTLKAREKRKSGNADAGIPVKACVQCTAVYERIHKICPFCGYDNPPAARDSIEFVDGDLMELDAATLAKMRGEVERVDMDKEAYRARLASQRVSVVAQHTNVKRHVKNQETQLILRRAIKWWAGFHRGRDRSDSEIQKRFYFKFGIDALSAQALKSSEAEVLYEKIIKDMGK